MAPLPSVGWTNTATSRSWAAAKKGRNASWSSSRPPTSVPISTPTMPSVRTPYSNSATARSLSCSGTDPIHSNRPAGPSCTAVANASFCVRANDAANAGSAQVVSVTGTGESTWRSIPSASMAAARRMRSQHEPDTGRNTSPPRMIRAAPEPSVPEPASSTTSDGHRGSPVAAAKSAITGKKWVCTSNIPPVMVSAHQI